MTTSDQPQSGQPVHLAQYTCDVGDRVLIGQRVDGIVRITDCPADGQPGRRYLVEDGLERLSELQALIDDYLAKASTLGYVPMHGWF
jgi:hypothetical protein